MNIKDEIIEDYSNGLNQLYLNKINCKEERINQFISFSISSLLSSVLLVGMPPIYMYSILSNFELVIFTRIFLLNYIFSKKSKKRIKFKEYLLNKLHNNEFERKHVINSSSLLSNIKNKYEISEENERKLSELLEYVITSKKTNEEDYEILKYFEGIKNEKEIFFPTKLEEVYWNKFNLEKNKNKLNEKIKRFEKFKFDYFKIFKVLNENTLFKEIDCKLNKSFSCNENEIATIIHLIDDFFISDECKAITEYVNLLDNFEKLKHKFKKNEVENFKYIEELFLNLNYTNAKDFLKSIRNMENNINISYYKFKI